MPGHSVSLAADRFVRSLQIAFEGSYGAALLEKLAKNYILGFANACLHHRRCEALCETQQRTIGTTRQQPDMGKGREKRNRKK